MKRALLLVALLATPAAAQTTNCWHIGSQLSCTTIPPVTAPTTGPVVVPSGSGGLINNMLDARRQAKADKELEAKRELVIQAIDRGDCKGAVAAAIRAGDTTMLQAIADACKAVTH